MNCLNCGAATTGVDVGCMSCGSGMQKLSANAKPVPNGVRGWSWGAFLANWIWAICNKTWLGLLCFVPGVGFIMAFILGFKGREWAWRNDEWENLEHFNRVQAAWSKWSLIICAVVVVLWVLVVGASFSAASSY